jgi:hypothetical protein
MKQNKKEVLKLNSRGALKLLTLCLLIINVIFNVMEYYTSKNALYFSKKLLNKNFYDKMFVNNEEYILNVINSKTYTSNVLHFNLILAVVIFLLFLFSQTPKESNSEDL